ncbi:MAG: DNA-directed RNA polymerase subunit alpha [Chloroflexi bacterium]|nr:DNA-directed RNA polymerase subunit alpha [Chloroflexota bacterium]MCH8341450.1 DNA-directed RNA polymerase subunit alpha [Chloroflexota bacterium]MCH8875904.1 DNA-directed RNA polymerase subunit alpha [Chloroflexota bacterium]
MALTTNMVMPKIEREAVARNYGKFVISPLERGYGITMGNALRRVLLSSLEGTATTSIRISEVSHEFTVIPGVREDVLQVILNIKELRMILHEGDSARLRIEVKGEGVVTAADVIVPAEVEIVNPELYLFTVDNDSAQFEIELNVERGRGYSPSDERGRLPIGELPTDAIFSPVRKVNFEVGQARVGQDTTFDRLTTEIWTDGTIKPEDALSVSATILIAHLRDLAGVTEESLLEAATREEEPQMASEVYEIPIENLDLSVRVFNSLKRTGITSVGEVLDMLDKGSDAMLSIRNFGEKSLDELKERLEEKGYLDSEGEGEQNSEAAVVAA